MTRLHAYFLSAMICAFPVLATSCGDDDEDESLNPPTEQKDPLLPSEEEEKDNESSDGESQVPVYVIDEVLVGSWLANADLSSIQTEGGEDLSTILGKEVDFSSAFKKMSTSLGAHVEFHPDGSFVAESEKNGSIQGTCQTKGNELVLEGKNEKGVPFILQSGTLYEADALVSMIDAEASMGGLKLETFSPGLSAEVEKVNYSVQSNRLTVETVMVATMDLNKVEFIPGISYAIMIKMTYPSVNPVQTIRMTTSSVYDKE